MWAPVRPCRPETKGKSLEEIQQAWAEHDQSTSAPKDPTLQVDLA